MNSNAILRRLKIIESEIRAYDPPPKPPLAMSLISFHVGGWQRHESIVAGSIRALGYANSMELNNALRNDLPSFNERYLAAIDKMFADQGVRDVKSCQSIDLQIALMRLVEAAEGGGMRLPEL